jgi:peptidoglycan/xylan/chitin deacetylase (PgdA/CDA1 family)
MRPPYGSYNDEVRTAAARRGQAVVIWDFDSGDSMGKPSEQSKQAYSDLAAQHPSTVLTLNHDVYGECMFALCRITTAEEN